MTEPKIALVTGASRGAGAGIARGLGEKGMTVYVTGRTLTPGDAKGWDGTVLPGTVAETAEAVTKAGGKGIAVVCDHADDAQVEKLFAQIAAEQGRLDILVNNAAYMHHQLIEKKPFWEKEIAAANILDVGLRSAYLASWHAAPIMVKQKSGLIVFTSSFGSVCYMHGAAYGAQKAGVDKFAADMGVDFRGTGVAAVSLWMGPLLTERSARTRDEHPEQYEQIMANAETPEFNGRVIHALSQDLELAALNGKTVITAEMAEKYGITESGGRQPPSWRAMLGDPREAHPAIIA